MEKAVLAIVAATVVAGGGIVAWNTGALGSLLDASHGAIQACEEKTAESLRSPSSYKRIWAQYTAREPITSAEYREAMREKRRRECQPNCDSPSDQFTENYTRYVDTNGPVWAERLRQGKKLSPEQKSVAQLWAETDQGAKRRDERIKKNLPSDQTGFVTLQYDADNEFGATLRSFGMCRFWEIGDDGRFDKSDILLWGPVDDESGQQAKDLDG